MGKSYVSMAVRTCIVCGKNTETGGLLLNKTLKKSLDPVTVIDWEICPKCTEDLRNRKKILLVEVENVEKPHKREYGLNLAGRTAEISEDAINKDSLDADIVQEILEKRLSLIDTKNLDALINRSKEPNDEKN